MHEETIELLKILAEGCREYHAYTTKRKAKERCAECVVV